MQRAWGEFTGKIWDGEQMRSGTCKSFWRGGWYWADDGTSLVCEGRTTLHTCSGELARAHAQYDHEWVPEEELGIISGRAFFSSAR